MKQYIWRPIPSFGGLYEISSTGLVRSFHKRHGVGGKILSPKVGRDGYAEVVLCDGGNRKSCQVHRLVLLAFVGPCPDGRQVAHDNGRRDDNRLSNLRYATPLENSGDKFRHGTVLQGENHGSAKLTCEEVREIRASPLPYRILSESYGVSIAQISNIRTRAQWRSIQ